MKQFTQVLFLIASLLILSSCSRKADIIRQLQYVDLLKTENRSFHKYPDEFSTYLLKGILEEDLKAFHIDYDSSGRIFPMTLSEFMNRILEPYEYYHPDDTTETIEYTSGEVKEFLPSVTLLSFDNLVVNEEETTNYINFYHPSDVTPEGINRYICSVEFEPAIDYLRSFDPPLLWHNYKLKEWGWYNDSLFIPQNATSSQLAVDMIRYSDSTTLAKRLYDSTAIEKVKNLAENYPYFFNSKLNTSGEGELNVIFKNDSVFNEIARFTYEDMLKVAENKMTIDSVIIVPVSTAILANRLIWNDKVKIISQNGSFKEPLEGNDKLSRRAPRSETIRSTEFPPSQKFYFRTVERLIGENNPGLESLPELLYEGVRDGSIIVYRSDSLKMPLLSGEFFNKMILDNQDTLLAETGFLEVYQLITETVFQLNGKIHSEKPVGIGLFLPGEQVPEGINRPVGYFRVSEVNEYLQSIGREPFPFSNFNGYPLKSWNVEVFQENN